MDRRYRSVAELALALAPFAPARARPLVDRARASAEPPARFSGRRRGPRHAEACGRRSLSSERCSRWAEPARRGGRPSAPFPAKPSNRQRPSCRNRPSFQVRRRRCLPCPPRRRSSRPSAPTRCPHRRPHHPPSHCAHCRRLAHRRYARRSRSPFQSLPETTLIAIDATYVYFTQQSAGTVSRVGRNGSGLRVLAASQDRPTGIAVDANNVYWVNQSTGGGGRVMKQSLGGGDPTELASSELYPEDIAVDATHVYWSNRAYTGSIVRVPIGGGSKTVLASGDTLVNTYHLAIDSTHVYWTNSGDGENTGSVMRVPLAGATTVETRAPNIDSPWAIAVYGNQVYFTNSGLSSAGLRRMGTAGGAISTLAEGYVGWGSIAVDASGVYVVGAGPSRDRLIRYSHDGSSQTPLAVAYAQDSVVVDANEVVWGSGEGIRATAKP